MSKRCQSSKLIVIPVAFSRQILRLNRLDFPNPSLPAEAAQTPKDHQFRRP
jgi:hypothetical protein